MCGRFTLVSQLQLLTRILQLNRTPETEPRYNIAPTRDVTAAVEIEGERDWMSLRWGLVPFWADDPSIGSRMINARSETVFEKPAFKKAIRSRRCLIPASGFYEWKKNPDGKKQPYYIYMKSEEPFCFAGIWETWTKGDEPLRTFAILTTEANELMKPLHHRMPVIVPREEYGRWLDPGNGEAGDLGGLLKPFPAGEMQFHPVSTAVNNPRNDGPECVRPAEG